MPGFVASVYDQTVREKEGRRGIAPRAWPEPTDVLLRSLEREARASSDREAYRELVQIPDCRLGLTAVLGSVNKVSLSVVVLLDRSPRATSIEAILARRGYASMHLDEGWIAHERAVPRGRLGAELRFLRGLLGPQEGSR